MEFPGIKPRELAYQRTAILGIPDSGKTVTAKKIAEYLMGAKIPIAALDPSGAWRHLRVPAKGQGWPIVVVGGTQPDIPMPHPDAAEEIIRAVMASGVSVVFDLYDPKLSKGEWRRIVEVVARVLFYENSKYGLRHIFIEEAAEFIPQSPGPETARVFGALDKISRMGRNAGLGMTIINQRAEDISKSFLELCDNLFLHRQKGRRSLQNLDKWLDYVATKEDQAAVIDTLPTLPQGQCWAWRGHTSPVLMKVPPLESYHPNIREMTAGKKRRRQQVDVSAFVSKLKAAMPKIEAEINANDPAKLRAEIAGLKKQLAAKVPSNINEKSNRGAEKAEKLSAAKKAAREEGFKRGFLKGHKVGIGSAEAVMRYINDHVEDQLKQFRDALRGGLHEAATLIQAQEFAQTSDYEAAVKDLDAAQAQTQSTRFPVAPSQVNRIAPVAERKTRRHLDAEGNGIASSTLAGGTIPHGIRIVLTAIAQYPGITTEHIAVLTDYKKTSRRVYLNQIVANGFAARDADRYTITDDGLGVLGEFTPLPTGPALLQQSLQTLPQGEGTILKFVADAFPHSVTPEEVQETTGYKKTSVRVYVNNLATRRLIVRANKTITAAKELF